MAKFLVGIFDDFKMAGDAFIALQPQYEDDISIIGKETGDYETLQRENDYENAYDFFGLPYSGSIAGSLGSAIKSFHTIQINDTGKIFLSGELGDAFSVTPSIKGEKTGGIKQALIDIGLPENLANIYKNFIVDGQVFIFVKYNKNNKDDIYRKLQDYGALAIEKIQDDLVD